MGHSDRRRQRTKRDDDGKMKISVKGTFGLNSGQGSVSALVNTPSKIPVPKMARNVLSR